MNHVLHPLWTLFPWKPGHHLDQAIAECLVIHAVLHVFENILHESINDTSLLHKEQLHRDVRDRHVDPGLRIVAFSRL